MAEKKNKKKSKLIEIIKMLYASEKGRALLFFGFYIIFFFVVILLVRSSHNTPARAQKEIKKEVEYAYEMKNLEEKNYHYKYLSTIGDDIFLYEGDRFQNKELFQVTSNGLVNNYYRDGDLFIKYENAWIVSENPYLLADFYEIDQIKKILEEAEFISKTEYKTGKYELKFMISTQKLVKLLTGQDMTLVEDSDNEIILELDNNKNIEKIEYDLTNFYTYSTQLPQNAIIEITYSNFGGVKEIEKP